MSKIVIGSARIDEHGKISGGAAGDQTGKEVSTQEFYVSSKGWNIIRAVDPSHRTRLSVGMLKYCLDDNIGYDQSNRLAILKYTGKGKTEADCSSLVRRCIIDATGKDVGNFTTANAKSVLIKSKLFTFVEKYNSKSTLLPGDILCTCTKGHIVIIISSPAASTTTNTTYKVGCTYTVTCSLNCRVLPDLKAKVVKVYHAGDRVTVKDIKVVNGNIWLKSNYGWFAGVYDKKVRVK